MGIVPRAVCMIFEKLSQRQEYGNDITFRVMMSCFEIYMETVKDLFEPNNL